MEDSKKQINKINKDLRIIKQLRGVVFLIETKLWNDYPVSTEFLEKEITTLERRKRFLKNKIAREENNDIKATNSYKGISIEEIKAIPIKTVLEGFGYKIERNNFFKLRNEKTPSAQFNEEKNVYYDHGDGTGGSVIDLVMKMRNLSTGEAIEFLKKMFF